MSHCFMEDNNRHKKRRVRGEGCNQEVGTMWRLQKYTKTTQAASSLSFLRLKGNLQKRQRRILVENDNLCRFRGKSC